MPRALPSCLRAAGTSTSPLCDLSILPSPETGVAQAPEGGVEKTEEPLPTPPSLGRGLHFTAAETAFLK